MPVFKQGAYKVTWDGSVAVVIVAEDAHSRVLESVQRQGAEIERLPDGDELWAALTHTLAGVVVPEED